MSSCSPIDTFLADPDCSGSCLSPLVPQPNGAWGCFGNSYYSTLGCISLDIFTQAECESTPGYFWQESFTNKSSCEANYGCQAGSTFNLQDKEQCTNCNGAYEPLYKWNQASWLTATPFNMSWIQANWTNVNTYKRTVDYQKVSDAINGVVIEKFVLAIQTESMCLYNPFVEVMSHIACDCAGDSNAPPNCYTGGTRVISVGTQRFYAGLADSIKAGPILITVTATTISPYLHYLDVNIGVVSASQFQAARTLSTEVLSNSLTQNPYAIIKNTHNAIVAQLVGDGASLQFTVPNATTKQGLLQGPMTLCVALRTDITQSKGDFPIPDFASTTDYKSWTPQGLNITITTAGYCANISDQGVYFPILRVSNWQSLKYEFISDPVVRGFIYFFGVVFILLSFVCMYQVFVAFQNARERGSLNLGLLLFLFMCLFNLVRGIYLLVLPSGKLEDNIAGKYFLAELPQFLFFSVFSIIIFCWAEVSMTVNSSKSFLHFFKWPFICTNILLTDVGLYVLFITMVSIFQNISVHQQQQLRTAYVVILAVCCVVAMSSFLFLGKKLLGIQMRASSLKSGQKTTATMKKMAAIMVVSSITILVQIIFLFVVTYSTVSAGAALVAYVLTEIIPSATLIITLRPISRKLARGGATSSTEMKSKDVTPHTSAQLNPNSVYSSTQSSNAV